MPEFWGIELGGKLEQPGSGGGWGPECSKPGELVSRLSALSLSVLIPVCCQGKAFTRFLCTSAVSACRLIWVDAIQSLQGEGRPTRLHALHPAGRFSLQLIIHIVT